MSCVLGGRSVREDVLVKSHVGVSRRPVKLCGKGM
jgi:hypothetical protein